MEMEQGYKKSSFMTSQNSCVPHMVALLTNSGIITSPTRPPVHSDKPTQCHPKHPPTLHLLCHPKRGCKNAFTCSFLDLWCVSGSCHSHVCNGVALITLCSRSHQDQQLLFWCIFNLTINQGALLTNGCNYRKGHYKYGYASLYVCTIM